MASGVEGISGAGRGNQLLVSGVHVDEIVCCGGLAQARAGLGRKQRDLGARARLVVRQLRSVANGVDQVHCRRRGRKRVVVRGGPDHRTRHHHGPPAICHLVRHNLRSVGETRSQG